MPEKSRSTFLRRKLGAKLRRMREEAKMSIEEAAPLLDKKRSALQRIEAGETKADVHLVRTMMDKYDRYEEELLDEVREAAKNPWYHTYGFRNLGYVDVETEATMVRQCLPVDVPGLLQTEAYIRSLFRTDLSRTEQRLDADVRIRLIRQRRLIDPDRPLRLVAIVYEAALRRQVGGPQVMLEQLRHLLDRSSLPTVTLQVIPLEEGAHLVPNATFNLLSFPDPGDQELLYVEYPTGSLHIEDECEVRAARLVFDQLETSALSPIESAALIEGLMSRQAR